MHRKHQTVRTSNWCREISRRSYSTKWNVQVLHDLQEHSPNSTIAVNFTLPGSCRKSFSSDFVRLQIMRDLNVHSRVLSDPNVGSPPKQLLRFVLPQWLPSEKTWSSILLARQSIWAHSSEVFDSKSIVSHVILKWYHIKKIIYSTIEWSLKLKRRGLCHSLGGMLGSAHMPNSPNHLCIYC